MAKLSSREAQWQAESDAQTILRFQELQQDPKRSEAAIKRAKEMAQEYTNKATNIGKSLTGLQSTRNKAKNKAKKRASRTPLPSEQEEQQAVAE